MRSAILPMRWLILLHYKKYESASEKFQNDSDAQKALQEYRAKAKDLQTKQMFNTVTETEQQDLQRLWVAFLGFKSVQDFFDAQGEFQALMQSMRAGDFRCLRTWIMQLHAAQAAVDKVKK